MLQALQSINAHCVLLSYRGETTLQMPGIRHAQIPFRFVRGNPLNKVALSVLWLLLAPLYAACIARKENIGLIYCDDSIPYYGYLAKLLIGKRHQVVMRLGDLQTGYLFASQGSLKQLAFKILHGVEVYTWRRLDGLVPISESFRRFVTAKGIPPQRQAVVLESIDLEGFLPLPTGVRKEFGISEDETLVMFHGAIEKAKGVETLVRAAEELLPRRPSLRFMVVGDGTQLAGIRDLVRQLGLEERVLLPGWIPFARMPLFLNAADIGIALRNANMANNFVVTTALMQYWACEKPLLAPDLESVRDIVQPGVNGLLFTPGDPHALASAIERMLQLRADWPEMGRKGREMVVDLFEKSKIGKRMVEALQLFHARGSTDNPGKQEVLR
jgi:glycosyltransferase involved in cell wall biosynthesis